MTVEGHPEIGEGPAGPDGVVREFLLPGGEAVPVLLDEVLGLLPLGEHQVVEQCGAVGGVVEAAGVIGKVA